MVERHHDVELHLHVPLKDRVDLSAEGAVQGELFATEDAEDTRRGYRGTVASKVAGITYRQLDYWARKQIVEPSITPSHGSGSRRLYSFKDVVILAVSKRLLDAGVNLQNVTAAIGFLSRRTTAQLADVTIMCDGQQVYECTTSEQMLNLLRSGKAVFGVSVGSLWHEIDEALEHEDYVDLASKPAALSSGRPIDELTAMRMRKKLEAQRAARQAA
ncbi:MULTISPECIES: MerR family transcriptional regulator [Bifidobacterium]|uniref:MerR family transcriptional regulator n=2 Tax=Bifidobacterium pullorum TaxID=78448 RepID=A0A087AS96_9BIFI|nr:MULTISPECIES: MerR family transcriptional regulator [Bifidobacterium]KFI61646.1 transcriptional regulator, MerR family [Bifidobacterium pullorum subsp. gallinarum]KFI83781.1 transcriptional regulator, MerR family [Bifidobacterium pullorum]MBE5065042.1 MerR family transcriptional regulator [Bifidobacterium pullorum subsp. saeculare]MBM6706026.1 MerR family transcriptional regulator [Bifidobacterium pullorum subsp. saeculare]MBM6729615.1 MerR family transcriptional regulator [Bifidobacterium 